MVEGDGGVGPVEVVRHRHLDRKDFPALPLVLSRCELCRRPAIDHVAVVNYEEPVIFLADTSVVVLVLLLVILL